MVYISSSSHNYETSFVAKGHLKIPTVSATTYGQRAFISMATNTWNNIHNQIKDAMLNTSPKIKWVLFKSLSNLRLHCFF